MTMHTGSRKSIMSRQPKNEKRMENMTVATNPIHKPQIQAKSQIIRTVILKADRRARVQSKKGSLGFKKHSGGLVINSF